MWCLSNDLKTQIAFCQSHLIFLNQKLLVYVTPLQNSKGIDCLVADQNHFDREKLVGLSICCSATAVYQNNLKSVQLFSCQQVPALGQLHWAMMQAHDLFRHMRIPELVDVRQYVRTLPTNTLVGFGAFAALTTYWYATRPKALKPPCDLAMQSVEVEVSVLWCGRNSWMLKLTRRCSH